MKRTKKHWMQKTPSSKSLWYSNIKFTVYEVDAILKVLKHSQDFGQGVAPDDTVASVVSKIENYERTK